MDANKEARELFSLHGRRASQIVVDEMVAAIRRGDDPEASRCQAVLRELEAMLLSATRSEDQAAFAEHAAQPPQRS